MTAEATYGDLFAYLRTHQRSFRGPDSFFLVKRFLGRMGIAAQPIIDVLEGFGGYDDIEVVMNAAGRIRADTPLTAAVETPFQYAIRHELFVYPEGCQWGEPDITAALQRMMEDSYR